MARVTDRRAILAFMVIWIVRFYRGKMAGKDE
jgi:hypothetical protein